MRSLSLLSLPVVAVLLAALTLALVLAGRFWWNLGLATFALLVVPVVLAVAYLAWYRTLPYEPARPAPSPSTFPFEPDDEPFEDPVEEADRFEAETAEEEGGKGPEDSGVDPNEPS